MGERKNKSSKGSSTVFKVGAIALAFLIIGYEAALFVHRAAVLRVESLRDTPDTVFVIDETLARKVLSGNDSGSDSVLQSSSSGPVHPRTGAGGRVRRRQVPRSGTQETVEGAGASEANGVPQGTELPKSGKSVANSNYSVLIRKNADHSEAVENVRTATRKVESFKFNPNTVSVEDLVRLGFTPKQAQSIDNYRQKGGRFRRKSDFASSYVVSDSIFKRLEPFIDIPLLDINAADSAAFDALPGIGPYFAAKMVEHRKQLGGYSSTEQLMDIYHFDRDKYNALKDLIFCSPSETPFALWTLPAEKLKEHPYIRNWQTAKAIVLYRDNNPRDKWTVEGLYKAGVISEENFRKLSLCRIAEP